MVDRVRDRRSADTCLLREDARAPLEQRGDHAGRARLAGDLNELATSPLPNLCSDVATWKQTAFQSFPAASATLVGRIQAIEPVAVPARLLAPYERGSDAGLYARTTNLEGQIGEFEFVHGQADWDQLLETLGLNQ